MKPTVLVLDADARLIHALESAGYRPVSVPVPGGAGADLLRVLRAELPNAPLVAVGDEEDVGVGETHLRALPADESDIRRFEDEERDILRRALELTGWNVKRAAERLGLGSATVYRKIDRYGLRNAS